MLPRVVTAKHGLLVVRLKEEIGLKEGRRGKIFRVARLLGAQGEEASLEWMSPNLWPTREKAERELHKILSQIRHAEEEA